MTKVFSTQWEQSRVDELNVLSLSLSESKVETEQLAFGKFSI